MVEINAQRLENHDIFRIENLNKCGREISGQ